MVNTLVIGAGLSGLAAALELSAAGRTVSVVDKGHGVGGRLATRRIGGAHLDHGAQFFTVRGERFRTLVDAAQRDGVVGVWCHGFSTDDGYPRFYCPQGMTALAKWMTSTLKDRGVTVTTGERVSMVRPGEQSWLVAADSGVEHSADNLIVTAPVPQALELLDAGNVDLDGKTADRLAEIRYKPTLALLVTLDGPSSVPHPGGIQNTEDDLFTFIADNQRKGISERAALTFHVNGAVSTDRWDDNPAIVIADLLEAAKPFIGGAPIVEVELKKWKYAGPYAAHPDRCVVARTDPGHLVLAGDAFGGPKVEGAFNSGQAAAAAILA